MEPSYIVGICRTKRPEDELRQLFGEAGEVVSAAVITDRETGSVQRLWLVEMKTQAEARKKAGQVWLTGASCAIVN